MGECAIAFRRGQGDEEQALGEGMGCGCEQKALTAEGAGGNNAENQESAILNAGKDEETLDAVLGQHEQGRGDAAQHGDDEPGTGGSEEAGIRLAAQIELAHRGHVNDGEDESEQRGGEFIGEAEKPEQERDQSQLEANTGEQAGAAPGCFLRDAEPGGRSEACAGEHDDGEVSEGRAAGTRFNPHNEGGEQRRRLEEGQAGPLARGHAAGDAQSAAQS